jgi:ATP-dependent DNA helicase RecG
MTGAGAKTPTTSPLGALVTTLYGVGPERASQLHRLGIRRIEELLLHRPRRYEDRRRLQKIAALQEGEPAIVHGKVVAQGTKWYRQHTKSIFEIILEDGTARLHCRWWNLPYMEKYFALGDEVLVFGKPIALKPRTMDHPETEVLEGGEEALIHLNRITPVYPLTDGLPQRWLRALIWRTLQAFGNKIPDPLATDLARLASGPDSRGARHTSLGRGEALRLLHFPEETEQAETARRRLALEEFFELQMQIQQRRRNFESRTQALACGGDNHLIRPFLAQLGFKLTEAQTRVLRELRQDMSGRHPMRRLLQGDVGSGKTVVAACCALMALEGGFNVVLMAPTEILAEQHFLNFSKWFEPLGVRVELQTGSRKTLDMGDGQPVSRNAAAPLLVIGTHALIQSGFALEDLGLVIIDEQHKFGVAQREELVRKGNYPHLLVMTATPIPRTLGLTLYGELDVSTISELPPGRGRIKTFVRTADKLPKVWDFIRSQLRAGRQAYVVYSRVDEESLDVKAVTKEFTIIQEALEPFRIGLVHGRLPAREKEMVMTAFRAGEVQVLVATSVIEVGVDVPNANIMLIENAEQFGLAQLHQLRGRIGRGAQDSFCILVAAAKSQEAQQRLRVLEMTADGFKIAEADLKLRGPGELLGQQQSGIPQFRFGDLATDLVLIQEARELARRNAETLKR